MRKRCDADLDVEVATALRRFVVEEELIRRSPDVGSGASEIISISGRGRRSRYCW